MFSLGKREERGTAVYSTALALLQQGKAVSAEQIYESLPDGKRKMDPLDIGRKLQDAFEMMAAASEYTLELEQALMFANAAYAHWKGAYGILVVRTQRGTDKLLDIYGVMEMCRTHPDACAANISEALGYLKRRDVRVSGWYPIPDYKRLLNERY